MKQNVLKKILIESQRPRSVCVFDLDSTLFNVSGRTQVILRQALLNLPPKHPCSLYQNGFSTLVVSEKDFSLKDIFKRNKIHLEFECYKYVFSFWTKHFFSNQFLKYDKIYTGVFYYLHLLKNQNTEVMYLTGRSFEKMGEGTYEQLSQLKLPLQTKKHLMMKKNTYTEDAYHKKCYLEKLSKQYSNIWFFENEPSIINFVYEALPQIEIVFRKSVHSGRQRLQKSFLEILDFTL